MKKGNDYLIIALITILLSVTTGTKALDYYIDNGRFIASEGKIPNGCFGQLITELNGDNSIAAIFVNSPSLRGCIAANYPYPGKEKYSISYTIKEALNNHQYKLTICQGVDGSMGLSCNNVLVKFVNRDYTVRGHTKKVLSLEKIGEW